jgi:excisionase family DNA binding protein
MSEPSSRHAKKLSRNCNTGTAGPDAKALDPLAVSPAMGAAILGVGRSKFYELLNKEIPALKVGRRTLIRVTDIEKYLDSLSLGGERR